MSAPAQVGAALLGGTLASARTLGGGDLSQVQRIVLTDGREAVVKSGPLSRAEASMLRAIAAAGAPAPAVLAASDDVLVMEALPTSGSLSGAWENLGMVLAGLHGASGRRYGWDEDYAFGPVAIANGWMDNWPEFWAERRLVVNTPHIPPALARRLEALALDLTNRLPARPLPSLLHGDLWSGNVVVSNGGRVGLIDPACYYGHAEVDLAMLTLFGNPGAPFFAAYTPLEPGYNERQPVYQLWPALVHLRLFGSGYWGMVDGLLSAAGV